MSRGWLAWLLLVLPGGVAAAPNPGSRPRPIPAGPPGPVLEISSNRNPLVLPPVPRFAVPTLGGGLHSPRELLIGGERLHGRRVKVGGYITWIYDCATALAERGKTRAQIQRRIDADPSLCDRPRFYVGDAPSTPPERSLWVVDVPRPPNPFERQRLPAAELARWPAVPALAVGRYVELSGTFAIRSPHNEANADGLLIYGAVDTSHGAPPTAVLTALPAPELPELPPRRAPELPPLPEGAGDSIRHANAGNRAYLAHQYETAIAEYDAAVRAWDGNHIAWYGLAGARSWRGDHRGAADAAGHCVALVPDQPMYWLLRGQLLYEAMLADARSREARAQGRRADQVIPDRATLDATPALQALLVAIRLEPKLWRAHFAIGRILRDRGDAQAAAEQLSAAIALHAWEPGPYIALCALYRRWQFRDQALAIAELGSAVLPGSAEIWVALGMARDDRNERGAAIAAYSKALEIKRDHVQARFQRGLDYLRARDAARARGDLQAFVNAGGTGFEIDRARHILALLAR